MVIQMLSVEEGKLVKRIKRLHKALSTKTKGKEDLYVPSHDKLFSDASGVLEKVTDNAPGGETGEALLSIIAESTSQLLHARNYRPRFESRYRAEAKEHRNRFFAEVGYINALVDLAIETCALNEWHDAKKYRAVMSAYTQMRSGTAELIKYLKTKMKKGRGRSNDIFRDKVTSAFEAAVKFREVFEDYVDSAYHAKWFDEKAYGKEARLRRVKQVIFSDEAKTHFEGSPYGFLLGGNIGAEVRYGIICLVEVDPELSGQLLDSRRLHVHLPDGPSLDPHRILEIPHGGDYTDQDRPRTTIQ